MDREAERKEAKRSASLEEGRVCEGVGSSVGGFEHVGEGENDFAVEALGGEAADGGIGRFCSGGCGGT